MLRFSTARARRPPRAGGARPGKPRDDAGRERASAAAIPLGPPTFVGVAVLAAACVAWAVTFRMSTPDVWQHLLVGKAIWQLGRVPHEHLWTWPLAGTPEVPPSWGFRALLWPFWLAGGTWGLQVWRWLTTLLAFGLGVATARRLGARGLAPLFVAAIAALSYRSRGQVRPETLTAVLLALEIWVLERRRARGGGALALIAIAWAWANVHISYYLGLALIGIHLVAPAPRAAPGPAHGAHRWLARLDALPLPAVLVTAIAVSFANPSGWRALAQPVQYFLVWRHEPIYQTIPELAPLLRTWPSQLRSGLPLLLIAWPLLALARAAARRFDPAEALTCALLSAHVLMNQRFSGALVVAMTPYLARDLSELAAGLRVPEAARRPAVRAALVVGGVLLASLPAWTDPRYPPGVGFVATCYPAAACDFIKRHDVRGRLFNPYYFGGYVLWRFWPERGRLPFMDIHQSGTRADRDLYAYAFADADAWRALEDRHRFDVALLDGHQEWVAGDRLLDVLDADAHWALVFRDDAAALYVRRDGRLASVADSFAYRVMPGGAEHFAALGETIARDDSTRRLLRRELERRAADSPLNAQAHSHLANLDFMDGNRAGARAHLERALAVEPRLPGVHLRLGYLAMAAGAWREAIREFDRERALGGPPADEYQRTAEAWERLGDRRRAAAAFRRELNIHAGNAAARAGLLRVAPE
ncbi:MAG TPA: hypothetical protein VI504_13935 [Candidatus Eisenbacteria bacterium]|jgi:tetratricopeptide (TPR) repeat protein